MTNLELIQIRPHALSRDAWIILGSHHKAVLFARRMSGSLLEPVCVKLPAATDQT